MESNYTNFCVQLERACSMHGAKMSQYRSVQKGQTSADFAEHWCVKNFEASIKKKLTCADTLPQLACMYGTIISWP